jgi:hypothetical protein
MMSRIRLYLENVEDTEDARVGAFVAVRGDFGVFYVTQTMAERIERALDRCDVKLWLKFTDWAGSRVRIRAAQIRSIVEITPEQRANDRKLWRALRREEKADRRAWEDDD